MGTAAGAASWSAAGGARLPSTTPVRQAPGRPLHELLAAQGSGCCSRGLCASSWQMTLSHSQFPSHPADFLVTHPEQNTAGVILQLRDHLVAQGQLVPPAEAMCRWEVVSGSWQSMAAGRDSLGRRGFEDRVHGAREHGGCPGFCAPLLACTRPGAGLVHALQASSAPPAAYLSVTI